ncbi:Rv0361 family membrane protein [Blastococcus sp. SYSU D00813]
MSTASEGPFLYDEGPEDLHTGTPRNRNGLLLAIMLGTVVLGVVMVLLIPVVKGTAEEQSTGAVNAFYAALADGDLDSAGQLLCQAERQRLADTDPAEEYVRGTGPEVTGTAEGEVDGDTVQRVTVRWDDGATATLTVVNEDGPHVCGIE